jgi:hypothetical protein
MDVNLRSKIIEMNKKPLVEYGWLRALLFVLLGFPLALLMGFGMDFLIKSLFPYGFAKNAASGAAFLYDYSIRNFGFVIMLFLFRYLMDKQTFYSLGFEWIKFQKDAWLGFFTALIILFIGSLTLLLTKHLFFINAVFNATPFFIAMLLFMLVAFLEETVFRGYLLNNLLQSMNKWWALILSSGLFAILHINNNNANLLSIINIFAAGMLLGVNYIYTKNLWFAICFHFGWNFFQGAILGYNVSGIETGSSILQQRILGNEIITGGAFGFEASILCTGLFLAAILILVKRYEKQKII